jgi:flavin reductase (DIM6/NTAB) family NADH-FMN oxidoreductase RutF
MADAFKPNGTQTPPGESGTSTPRDLAINSKPASDPQAANRMDAEGMVKRNPHPDFKKVEASRPDFPHEHKWHYVKTPNPNWQPGDGANDGGESLKIPHVEIDPYEAGRPAVYNYKLLISGIVPRPIGFLSTRSADGKTTNLAPFSYTQMINHDPPLFVVGFAGGFDNAKDSLANLKESGECVINMISEHFIEAANATSVNAPYGVSEWAYSGLTPAACTTVKAERVKESVFAIEGKVESLREFESKGTPGKKTGVLAIIEGTRFWVREDALNKDKNLIDPAVRFCLFLSAFPPPLTILPFRPHANRNVVQVYKPMSRVGGITYARVNEALELPRPDWAEFLKANPENERKFAVPKGEGQE